MRFATIICVLLAGPLVWAQEHDSPSMDHANANPHEDTAEQLVAIVTVQAVQGTEGGPTIAGGRVTIELLDARGHGRKFEAQLDEHGVATVELPLTEPFKPLVTIEYGGTTYQAIGEEINAGSLEQLVKVTVFETTDKPVDWHVQERHVVLTPSLDGIGVTDTLVIQNPSDTAWLGAPNDAGQRVSFVLDLPAGAVKVELGRNLQLLSATVIGDKVVCTAPLRPGRTMFRLSFLIPLKQQANRVVITSPARSTTLRVFVPVSDNIYVYAESDGELLKSLGFTEYGMKGHQTPMEVFGVTDQLAGQKLTIIFSGLPRRLTLVEQSSGSPYMLRIAAAVGSVVMLVLSVIALLRRPARTILPSRG